MFFKIGLSFLNGTQIPYWLFNEIWFMNEQYFWVRPRGKTDNVLDCDIVGRGYKLYSHRYVYFQTNILKKGMNSLICPALD